jgi:hypothetical protein
MSKIPHLISGSGDAVKIDAGRRRYQMDDVILMIT